jgi:multidrug transporter EmrE-like cation transporter
MVRSIGAGVLLGLPNLGSLVFLVRALAQLDGSLVFPINNMGIVLCSSLLGSLLFRQPLTRWSIFGISSAVLGIWLISG